MKDRSLLTGPYADDGWGWTSPTGEKYWFVAYACHWTWKRRWLPAITDLAEAYVLTGDRKYAEKCAALLDRIAEVYPGMDYSRQSRMGQLKAGRYKGKIENHIWETFVLRDLAIAYDRVFDTLVGNDPISLPWRSADAIRAHVEAGILEEGLDAFGRGDIQGNFGMHQAALAYVAAVRQCGRGKALCRGIFDNTGIDLDHEGLNFALYNLVYKDGMPYETSPFYCSKWVESLVDMARPLSLVGMDLYDVPRFSRVLSAPLELLCVGQFTPAIGDAGAITSKWIGPDAACYEAAYRRTGNPRYAWAFTLAGGRSTGFNCFDDLFEPPLDSAKLASDTQSFTYSPSSRVMDGYGAAILNNKHNSLAVSMFYGPRSDHGHFDRLNLELFGCSRRLSPDLGYPDFMNPYMSGVYTWTKNTVSHNCVVVDDSRQDGNSPGQVLRFHESPTVHVVDVDAKGCYAQTDVYRRTLVLVETGTDNGYLVDVFRVRGGKRHVLSIHGGEGDFTLKGALLSAPETEGTLAGAGVSYGEPYDDPKLLNNARNRTFAGYKGSGYSHLFNWQSADASNSFLTGSWHLNGLPDANLQVHIAPAPGQHLTVADAYASPTRQVPTVLKYLLAARDSGPSGSVFVTVWECFNRKPQIDSVKLHTGLSMLAGSDEVTGLTVHRGAAVDVITVAPEPGITYSLGDTISSDSAVVVVTIEAGQATRVFAAGGSHLTGGTDHKTLPVPGTIRGFVQEADIASGMVTVLVNSVAVAPHALIGLSARFFNDAHSCLYTIESAEQIDGRLVLKVGNADMLTGRVHSTHIDSAARTIVTDTNLVNPARLVGMSVTAGRNFLGHIVSAESGQLRLAEQGANAVEAVTPKPGQDLWIVDFGPGDKIEIEQSIYNGSKELANSGKARSGPPESTSTCSK